MNCKVCGNAVSYYERTCSVCGNDLEAQRREAAGIYSGAAQPGSFYAPPQQNPTPSLAHEKDQAINRILYDTDGASAHDRLEERRKKRQEEKVSTPHTGFPSFFTQERKEEPPADHSYTFTRPAEPQYAPAEPQYAPAAPQYAPAAPQRAAVEPPQPQYAPVAPPPAPTYIPAPEAEERPLRRFSNEFVFGNRTEPAFVPQTPEPREPYAPVQQQYAPVQQAFSIPPAPDPAAYAPGYTAYPEAYEPQPSPAAEPYFALTPSDEEQAKFNIDKKNEEFQELLDREFEKLKTRESEPQGYQGRPGTGSTPSGTSADDGRKPYIQDRIDDYLRKSEQDAEHAVRRRPDEPANNFEAARVTEPGYTFDDKDYGPVFTPGEAAFSDFDVNGINFGTQEGPARYTDFGMYDFPPAPASYEQPAPYVPPVPPIVGKPPAPEVTPWGPSRNEAPTRESIAAFIDRPIEFPFDEKGRPGVSAGRDSFTPAFEFDPSAPAVYQPAQPVAYEPPAPPSDTGFGSAGALPSFEQASAGLAQPFTAPGPSAPEFAAPFVFDDFSGTASEGPAEPGPAAVEETALKDQETPPDETAGETPWPGVLVEPALHEAAPSGGSMVSGPESEQALSASAPEAPVQQEPQAPEQPAPPDFVDLMTANTPAPEGYEDHEGPPAFYKAYTQGLSVQKVEEAADAAASASAEGQAGASEAVPGFLKAYDNEQLGKGPGEKPQKTAVEKKDPKNAKTAGEKKRSPAQKKADARRTALSIVITILIVILVIVVACILVLKFMPGSVGAYYIQDVVELVQGKLGIGGSA